jgi:putative hydrolase of the HAD superfamily
LIEGTIEALQSLREAYRLAIVSNGYAGFVHETLKYHDIEKYFDTVIVSQEVDMEKPDARIYKKASKIVGVPLEQTLMVGDGFKSDIMGPREVGMFTCWVNPRHNPVPDASMCDLVINRLAELPAKLHCAEILSKQ